MKKLIAPTGMLTLLPPKDLLMMVMLLPRLIELAKG
ncbi:hypothetical protein BAZSYMB_SCAFFOLD00028_14 [Bathymodiolus azoricus thioautotrophic gill symbiont]|nr:hypothetical protein BAZSYMB_SCAFFOLD00028_14 [Bathymodiolus azoricus thioautotrophic gill symbiont]